jgi:hemoglobin
MASLYEEIGGESAVDAAVDNFYVKVLADDRTKDFFLIQIWINSEIIRSVF